jgi:hypothetical protein
MEADFPSKADCGAMVDGVENLVIVLTPNFYLSRTPAK